MVEQSIQQIKPKLDYIGVLVYFAGLIILGIRDIVLGAAYGFSLSGASAIIAGIIALIVGGLLIMMHKEVLRVDFKKLDLFKELRLMVISFLLPLYVVMIGLVYNTNLMVAIGYVVAGLIVEIILLMLYIYRYRELKPEMKMIFAIMILVAGVFMAVGGFARAGFSIDNLLLAHGGILAISVILAGLGILLSTFIKGGTKEIMESILFSISFTIFSIALIVGGGLAIRDGASVIGAWVPGIFKAAFGVHLVTGVLGLIAGIVFVIVALLTLITSISKASQPAQPSVPEVPPPPPPPPQ
jgi:hypothetical protein